MNQEKNTDLLGLSKLPLSQKKILIGVGFAIFSGGYALGILYSEYSVSTAKYEVANIKIKKTNLLNENKTLESRLNEASKLKDLVSKKLQEKNNELEKIKIDINSLRGLEKKINLLQGKLDDSQKLISEQNNDLKSLQKKLIISNKHIKILNLKLTENNSCSKIKAFITKKENIIENKNMDLRNASSMTRITQNDSGPKKNSLYRSIEKELARLANELEHADRTLLECYSKK